MVYSGDTGPSPALEQLAEGLRPSDPHVLATSPARSTTGRRNWAPAAIWRRRAAAAAAGARRLVATHIYDQFDQPGVREKVIAEMSRVYDGVIVIGEDLMELSADPKKPGVFL